MSASNTEVVVDHVSDLSAAKEPILFLSFLFLQTDLFLEVGILDDLVQSGRNPRIQHVKIREMSIPLNWVRWFQIVQRIDHLHFFDPQHCLRERTRTGTYLGFESYLPTWKRWRCGKFVKLKLRDPKFLLISHVILWISSFCWKREFLIDGVLTNLGVGKVSLFCSSLLATSLPVLGRTGSASVAFRFQEWRISLSGVDAQSITACGLSTTFPGVPSKFRVSGRRLWSRLSKPRGLGTIAG